MIIRAVRIGFFAWFKFKLAVTFPVYTRLSVLGAIRLTIPSMLIVTLQIPAPVIAFVLRTVVGFLASAAIAILAIFALRLAIPAMLLVGLKISAPSPAFILCAIVGFLARSLITNFIRGAFCLAIPAMPFVCLKIPAPILAFILCASLLLALFIRIVRTATK